MTTEQIELALKMESEGKKQVEIAAAMGVDQSSISRALAKFPDSRVTARRRMVAAADNAAIHVLTAMKEAADRGDGSVALEVLDRLDVLPSKKHTAGGSGAPQVVVVVGAPPNAPINVNALPTFSDVDPLPPTE